MDEETLDVEGALKLLNRALSLQYRSVLQYTLSSGSLFGFAVPGARRSPLGIRAGRARRCKAAGREGRRPGRRADDRGRRAALDSGDPGDAIEWLIESEGEAVERLQEAIEPTGREGRSEALEHLLEHLIMRKQNQVDFLAARTPHGLSEC